MEDEEGETEEERKDERLGGRRERGEWKQRETERERDEEVTEEGRRKRGESKEEGTIRNEDEKKTMREMEEEAMEEKRR